MTQGQMDRLDTDKDGSVSEAEYRAFMAAAFKSMDSNNDGHLSASEAANVLSTQQFIAMDADGNGTVSRDEFMNRVMADFKTADRDGDGRLK